LEGKKTLEQDISFARQTIVFLEDKILEVKDYLEFLEKAKACLDHARNSGVDCPYPDFCGFNQPCLEGCPGGVIEALKAKEKACSQ